MWLRARRAEAAAAVEQSRTKNDCASLLETLDEESRPTAGGSRSIGALRSRAGGPASEHSEIWRGQSLVGDRGERQGAGNRPIGCSVARRFDLGQQAGTPRRRLTATTRNTCTSNHCAGKELPPKRRLQKVAGNALENLFCCVAASSAGQGETATSVHTATKTPSPPAHSGCAPEPNIARGDSPSHMPLFEGKSSEHID